MLLLGPLSLRPQSSGPWSSNHYACSPLHGLRTTAHGPLLQGRKTRLADGFPVTRFMLFEQAVAHQKRDAAFANFDRRDQDHAP